MEKGAGAKLKELQIGKLRPIEQENDVVLDCNSKYTNKQEHDINTGKKEREREICLMKFCIVCIDCPLQDIYFNPLNLSLRVE